MNKVKTLLALAVLAEVPMASADFIEDAKGSLELRNFYYNRDYRNTGAAQSKRDEWGQGFILNLQSGFTEGKVGFGVDAMGMLGVKLDSSPDRTGSGVLAFDRQRNVEDEYGKMTVTAKARAWKSELRVGGLNPVMPMLSSNNSRLLPQIFRGGMLVSKDFEPLTISALRLDAVKQRNSTDFEKLTASSNLGAYKAAEADHYNYVALDYKVLPTLTVSYHRSELEDLYSSQFFGMRLDQPAGPGTVITDLRYFSSKESGDELLGNVDNRMLSSFFGYSLQGHTIGGGYQKSWGETPFAYVNGTDSYLFGESLVSTFTAPKERVWFARYDYNFAAVGIPGLTLGLKYVKGDDVDPTLLNTAQAAQLRVLGGTGEEWERMTDITYTVQSGPLKALAFQWRNSTNRSNYADSANENRLIVKYTFNF